MERPIMHPQFLSDTEIETQTKTTLRFRHIKRAARAVWRLLRSELFFWRSTSGVRIEDAAPIVRFVRGLLYRMAFVPIIVVLIVVAMVYTTTHPPAVSVRLDPGSQGIYF